MREGKPEFTPSRARVGASNLRIPQMPLEWFGNSTWRLPSGKALAEFALQAGFLAPLLFKREVFTRKTSRALPRRSKALEKGGSR